MKNAEFRPLSSAVRLDDLSHDNLARDRPAAEPPGHVDRHPLILEPVCVLDVIRIIHPASAHELIIPAAALHNPDHFHPPSIIPFVPNQAALFLEAVRISLPQLLNVHLRNL